MTIPRSPLPLPLIIATVFSVASPGSQAGAETTDTIDETFAVARGGSLMVEVDQGQIEVRGEAGASVHVKVIRKINASSKTKEEEYLADHRVTIGQVDDKIIVRQQGKTSSGSWWNPFQRIRADIRYAIVVPTAFDIDLETSGGSLEVAYVTGTVQADTSGGSITCSDITGQVHADTSGGAIRLRDCRGEAYADTSGGAISAEGGSGTLRVETSGGSIRVSSHTGDVRADTGGGSISLDGIAGNVNAETSGGSITATLVSKPTDACRLSTSGGGIRVKLPADSAVNVEAATSGGSVHSDFEAAGHNPKERSSMRGTINGGGPPLHLHTSGGSIHIGRIH